MVFDSTRFLISLALSALIGGLAYRRGSLTRSGWLGAVLVGTATAGLGGWSWGVLVVVFFVPSSGLSHWRRGAKAQVAADKFVKGERRDLGQTLANGGGVALLALIHAFAPHPVLFAGAVGALATVTADTWATELGTLSRRPPRLITNGRLVSPGTSGGVTPLGLAATMAGALLIGLAAAVAYWMLDGVHSWLPVMIGLIGGVAGASADSVFGATIQAMRWCSHCETETEWLVHRCGTPTKHLRGWRWLDNDWVNFWSSLVGAGVGVLIAVVPPGRFG